MWYPDTPRHYTIPSSFARHYFLESDRTIHGRQRAFQVTETETGILQVIYLKSNWVLFVLYFQYGSHASCSRKEGHNRTEFFFFFFCISPVYTSGFCCSNSIQFLSCSSCSLKKSRIKVFKISMWFYCDLPQNHYGLGTCCKFEWDESLHRIDMTEISLSFLSTNQEKLATTSMSRVFPLSLFPALGDRRLHELSAFWLVDLNKDRSDCLLLLVPGN